MSEILVQEKAVVIPGQKIAEGMDYLPGKNSFRQGDGIFASLLGVAQLSGRVIKVTPLAGPYSPRVGDKIICKIFDIAMSGWRVHTGTAYAAMLNVRDASSKFIKREQDLSQILDIGDYCICKIINVTATKLIDVSMKEPGLKKIEGGRIIKINSQKVPRIIGKQGNMISLIREHTGCDITVAQNGFIWLNGDHESERAAEDLIKQIESRAHEKGLTAKIRQMLGYSPRDDEDDTLNGLENKGVKNA